METRWLHFALFLLFFFFLNNAYHCPKGRHRIYIFILMERNANCLNNMNAQRDSGFSFSDTVREKRRNFRLSTSF